MPRSASKRLRNSTQDMTQSVETEDSYPSQLSERDLQHQINECVIKILAENASLGVIKRKDLFRNTKIRGRTQKQLVDEVKQKLLNVYGLILMESGNNFILINPKNKILEEFGSERSSPKEVFLGIMLTLIVHNDDEITTDELKSFFGTLSIDIEGDHLYFGNIKKLLNELEHTLYLEKITKTVPSQPSQISYKWGIRSKYEVNKKDLIPIISLMYCMPPENLPGPLILLFSDD